MTEDSQNRVLMPVPPWVLSYMGYIGMCGPRGYCSSAILVIKRVSILADFDHFGHKLGMVFSSLDINKSSSQIMFMVI